jgi:tRNA(adenine34) deaminase
MFPLPIPMRRALDAAAEAAEAGEVPVGAALVWRGEIVAVAANAPRALCDPTAHAEMRVIRAAAAALGRDRLEDAELWVTLEPCAIGRLYYGASDPKGGAVEHGPLLFAQPTVHHRPEVYGGIGENEAADLLRAFFRARR